VAQRTGSPSNRKGTTSKYEATQVTAGVDRLSLSFTVDVADGNVTSWDEVKQKAPGFPNETFTWQKTVEVTGGASVFVGVSSSAKYAGHRQWGKVECNPSRLVDRDSWELATVQETVLCAGRMLSAVRELMEPVDPDVRTWNVKRIDVARDFHDVDEAGQMIRSLGAIHRPWSRLNQTHADPKRHGAQTLFVGSGAGGVRLYDKNAETKGDAPIGTVRWETEARAWARNYGGIKYFGDVQEASVECLARDRWEWSQMGAEVAGSTARLVKLVEGSGMTSAHKLAFLGFLVQQSAGVCSVTSTATLAKYRRLQRELGIVAPADFGSMVEVARRLDWDSGREVVSVRAA